MSGPARRWLELRARRSAPREGDRLSGDDPLDDHLLGGDPVGDALLVDALLELGGRAIEERDGWLVTHLPEPPDPEVFLSAARADLATVRGLGDVALEVSWIEHEDWAETWRRGLEPRRLTERLVVRPSWTDVPDARPDDVVLVVDPGMAFGTAEHGTTRGCLRLLDRVVRPGQRVIDVGAGSGILGIAAARLGARSVLAIESDPLAWDAIRENAAANGVGERVRLEATHADADLLVARGPVDGVAANIETGVLMPLLPGFRDALVPGGWLILSGIPEHEWMLMRDAAEAHGFAPVDVDADGAWRSGLFRR